MISNIVSVGPKGVEEGDIYLTFTFEWLHPEIQAGSAEEKQKRQVLSDGAQKGVHGTIEAIRRLVKDGQLQGKN